MGLSGVTSQHLTGEVHEKEVRRELDRILGSRVFRGSHRCQTFLQYVVTKTLEGDSKSLKERTLAVHIFGREATEDLSADSIVRVGAREVRKRLAQYYISEGANDPVRIDLPAGCYIPSFQWHSPVAIILEPELPAQEFTVKNDALPSMGLRWKLFIASATLLFALLTAAGWGLMFAPRSAFDAFWLPAYNPKVPVLIAIAHPIVYHPSLRAEALDRTQNGAPNPPIQRPIDLPPKLLNGSDFVPALNQYVGFGDAEAALRISSLFAQHRIGSRVRLASRMEFNDLRGSGTVLIGAYTNRWTMELTKNMRYRFEYHAGKPCISSDTLGCRWTLTTKADDGRSAEDYILVCRLPHSAANSFTVIVAGLNVYGTEEAGRIVSDSDSLTPILKRISKSWPEHNLELVLHVAVVGDAPAQSDLVSSYSW